MRSSATTSRGRRRASRSAQVLGAQLLGAGQRDRAEAEARDHREHPLGAVADSVITTSPRPHAAPGSAPASRAAAVGDLAEGQLAPLAVAGEHHQRARCGGAASTTSRAKFTRRGMLGLERCGWVGVVPRDVVSG